MEAPLEEAMASKTLYISSKLKLEEMINLNVIRSSSRSGPVKKMLHVNTLKVYVVKVRSELIEGNPNDFKKRQTKSQNLDSQLGEMQMAGKYHQRPWNFLEHPRRLHLSSDGLHECRKSL